MELRFESEYRDGKKIYILKLKEKDTEEFKKIYERISQKYSHPYLNILKVKRPITIVRTNNRMYIVKSSPDTEPFDVEREDIDDLVELIKEVRREISEREVLIYHI